MQGYLNLKKLITMKRLFLLLVAGLLASAATMQVGAQAPRHHGWEYYPLKGNVKSVVVYEVWDEESDPEPYATFEFCENGDVMAYYPEMLGDSSDYHSYKYKYNANGELVGVTKTNYYESTEDRIVCVYDSEGRLIQKTEQYSAYRYSYDANGNLVEMRTLDADDGSVLDIYRYKYDANGNRIEEVRMSPDGNESQKIMYRYNAEGKIVSVKEYDAFTQNYTTLECEFDAMGNFVKMGSYLFKIEYR